MPPMRAHSPLGEADVAVAAEQRTQCQRPPLFHVLIHNDHYTTMDFVVRVLREVFRKSEEEAVDIMWKVHLEGVGVAGTYTREIAETKMARAKAQATAQEFPLRFSLQPQEAP